LIANKVAEFADLQALGQEFLLNFLKFLWKRSLNKIQG